MSALKVPAGHGESEYIEKRSSFLGIVEPVSSEEEARAVIAAVKKQHRDARHNCWCYLIQGGAERYSDDGEPQGTAGIPMLEVFRKAGVSNAVCVVTRYFGGVLLGAGGLLRAYTKAAKDALENSGITEVIPVRELTLRCPYSLLERIRLEIAAAEAEILSTDYAADITLSIRIPEAKAVSFSERIFDLTSGTVKCE
ncbi:MAG: YigZ family protein [Oscillospiraceae bacterium]|jgi:uncharacterized YigZ family protein|nr:YigZ family protein [Oscillospiraceae bacterium]